MRILGRSLLVLVSAVAAAPPALVSSSEQGPFTLGVVRRDGIMIPFATYDGRRWLNTWPEPKPNPEIPLSLRDVPREWWGRSGVPASWTFWSLDGKSRPLRILAPVQLRVHCLTSVGLRTNYLPTTPPPPPNQHHHPKDGLAISGALSIERVEVLNNQLAEWDGAASLLAGTFAAGEDAAAHEYRGWLPGSQERASVRPALEVLCRSSLSTPGSVVYYYEATKQYPNPTGLRCNLVTFLAGFMHVGADGRPLTDIWPHVTNCNMREVDFLLPLGVLKLDGRTIWIVQFSGFGRERYSLLDVTDQKAVLLVNTFGGGC